MATANVSPIHVHHQPAGGPIHGHQHRRAMLRTMAAAGAVAAVPATAEAGIVDLHVDWHREWRQLLDWWNGPEEPAKDAGDHPVWRRMVELEDQIVGTPAATPEGMLTQIDVALVFIGAEDVGHECISREELALVSLRTSLAGRA